MERVSSGLEARGFRCFAPSLRAHETGVLHPEVGNLSVSDYVEDLKAFIKAQAFTQAPILLGHSMGGLLAQKLAAELDVFALVLLTPASPAGINATALKTTMAFARTLLTPGFQKKPHKPSFARARISAFTGLPERQHQPLYASLVEESGRALFEIAFWWADRGRASRVDAGAVRCPVYVVSAGLDQLTPASVVRKVAARYPGAALRHYPTRGHWVIDDSLTDDMLAEIATWLMALEQRAAKGMPLR